MPVGNKKVKLQIFDSGEKLDSHGLKTLSRDINLLKDLRLVDVTGDWLTFNLNVLDRTAQAPVSSQANMPGF